MTGLIRRIDGAAIVLYILSQFLYTHVLKAGFVITPLFYFLQYLDIELLKNDLWRSLLYLHAQPPLMNLIMGLMFHWFPAHVDVAVSWLYYLAGLAGIGFLSAGLSELGIRLSIRLSVIAVLCLFPTFALFARWAYATHLEFVLSCALLYALARTQNEPEVTLRRVLTLGIPFCLLGLIRAQWHPVIFCAWMALIRVLRRRRASLRALALGTVITMAPIMLVIVKNGILFGVWGTSSWAGMNLSGVAANSINTQQLHELKDAHLVGRDFPVYFRHERALLAYRQWEREGRALPASEHPSMRFYKANGMRNYNFQAYIEGGKQDMNDSLAIIRHYPLQYARHVLQRMWVMTQTPSISFKCCAFSLRNIGALKGMLYSDLPPDVRFEARMFSLALYGVLPLGALAASLRRRGYWADKRFFVLTGLFLVLASFVISCAASNLEQERIRWAMEGFYLAYVAMLAEMIARKRETAKRPAW